MAWPFTRSAPEKKDNPVGAAFMVPGGVTWQRPANRRAFIEEGYQQNVVVYRAVREITTAMADLVIEVHANGEPIENHPALALLARPNPAQGWDGFIKQAFTDYMLLGEMAIVTPNESGPPAELWAVNPIAVEVRPGPSGLPTAYCHKLNSREVVFPVDDDGSSQMFFMKMYNPSDYWRGQSPLVAAGLCADTHNAGVRWNYSLLKNSARPSGLIKLGEGAGKEVVERLREWFKRAFQGETNAGEIPVLPAGAEWQAMDNNPRDMDFLNTQKETAKLVASAFGVPLPLIDNDASTFNNLEQAKERFYTDTILPLFNEFLSQFGNWLLRRYPGGDRLTFAVDMDAIGSLESLRGRKFGRMMQAVAAGVLTVDEAREAIGYDAMGGASSVLDPVGSAIFNAQGDVTKSLKQAAALAYGDK